MPALTRFHNLTVRAIRTAAGSAGVLLLLTQTFGPVLASPGQSVWMEIFSEGGAVRVEVDLERDAEDPTAYCVNRHTRESHIQRSFRTHCGTERQFGGATAGPARSSRRKSTLLAVPSLLYEMELHDEKEFLQQMRAGPLDRRFPLFVGLLCMLFHFEKQRGLRSEKRRHPKIPDGLRHVVFSARNRSRGDVRISQPTRTIGAASLFFPQWKPTATA